MKKIFLRILLYLVTFVVIVGGFGFVGYGSEQKDYWVTPRKGKLPSLNSIKVPKYDPKKPTVAVLLGSPTTEVFDFVVPYEMFVMTEHYNVFAVAPDKKVTSLTGGIDLIPHYSFEELDNLLGKSPDLLVVPYMPMFDEKKYKPVKEWIQKHSNTDILSICGGAGNLADAGVLKGKSATIHWQFFDSTKKQNPETNWIRDLRYVEDGNIVGSAGLTSGIDAVLYVISQKLGEPMAEKIANDMNYPSYHFVKNPKVDPFYIDHTEAVYILNQAFQWNEKETGVLLYDGMEDGALASIFDTYSAAGTSNVFTISNTGKPIVTKHHLNLVPRYTISNAPKLDRMLVSGIQAKTLAKKEVEHWKKKGNTNELLYIHSESKDSFIFDATLEDLAKQEDVLTAKYGAKRLEYRAALDLKGSPFSYEAFGIFILLVMFSLLISYTIDRRFLMKKKKIIS